MKNHIDIVHHIIRCDPTITYTELLEESTPHLESFMTDDEISEYVFYKFTNYPEREEKLSKDDILWIRAEKQANEGNPNLLFHLQDMLLAEVIFYVVLAMLIIIGIVILGRVFIK